MYDTLPVESLRTYRTKMGLTVAAMAQAMGMPLRSYEDIEAGRNPLKPIHVKAANFAALTVAAERGGRDNLPLDLSELVRRIYEWKPGRTSRS